MNGKNNWKENVKHSKRGKTRNNENIKSNKGGRIYGFSLPHTGDCLVATSLQVQTQNLLISPLLRHSVHGSNRISLLSWDHWQVASCGTNTHMTWLKACHITESIYKPRLLEDHRTHRIRHVEHVIWVQLFVHEFLHIFCCTNEWLTREIIYTRLLWCTSVNISRQNESLELHSSWET